MREQNGQQSLTLPANPSPNQTQTMGDKFLTNKKMSPIVVFHAVHR